jgi:arginine/lysine/ornithine decarboxylase
MVFRLHTDTVPSSEAISNSSFFGYRFDIENGLDMLAQAVRYLLFDEIEYQHFAAAQVRQKSRVTYGAINGINRCLAPGTSP